MTLVATIAAELAAAEARRAPIAPIHARLGAEDLARAYEVQQVNIARRVAAGDRVVGHKIGLTSQAVQRQLGVDQPDFGTLLASMERTSGDELADDLVQPKAEAEVAFVLGRGLERADLTASELADAIAWVVPAIEIVDSRIADWKIGIVDTIADNASSARYVLGNERRRLADVELRLCGMVMEKNGAVASLGVGAACLGHPLTAALWLARTLAARGTPLGAGEVILSGALGPMVAVQPGDRLLAEIAGLGSVRASFAGR